MALKKSELYSSLWSGCDELRGGMDASQYKDYVLVLLFVKYVSDKYAGQPFAPITIPAGASFSDLVALKGKPTIGDDINKRILGPLASANKLSDMPDFNDATKLGTGKEMVDRLTNLIAIFENPALDFSKNRADGDDILGDAYEYLMRHFATESGKSKGQFYTPAEVSRVMAQILGIRHAKTTSSTTVYDPTSGSGSLLLKVGDEASHGKAVKVTLYGQEKDAATAGLARMNMILHDQATALIVQGNTLANPLFKDGDALKTFDYVVANIPFSDKRWSTGLDPAHDPFERFRHFGVPPAKQGDYAYLLHILRSLKSTGKGACILPHGVLFRGNAEAAIRKSLIQRGLIKAIIGLPANLFYGTGIPACIIVLDKEGANARKGIFMMDASKGFMKDGPKNRLREQDIHKIVDTFTRQAEVPRYSRLVPVSEIADAKNDYNLNLPRYIDSTEPSDLQDIDGHLRGGIPNRDIDALGNFWNVIPGVRSALFKKADRAGYSQLKLPIAEVKPAILGHAEFTAFNDSATKLFAKWQKAAVPHLKGFAKDGHPKALIETIAEDLLATFRAAPLLDAYDVYQHLMDYWAATMQDDCYLIAADLPAAQPLPGQFCTYVLRCADGSFYKGQTENFTKRLQEHRSGNVSWTAKHLPVETIHWEIFPTREKAVAREQFLKSGKGREWLQQQFAAQKLKCHEGQAGGWRDAAQPRLVVEDKNKKTKARPDFTLGKKKYQAELIPPALIIRRWYADEQAALEKLEADVAALQQQMEEMAEEHGGEEGLLADAANDKGKLNKASVTARLKELPSALSVPSVPPEDAEERTMLRQYLALVEQEAATAGKLAEAQDALTAKVAARYPKLTEDETKTLVVDDKWLGTLAAAVQGELDRVSQTLTGRIRQLAERYATPLPELTTEVEALAARVSGHLLKMGFTP